MGHAPWGHKEPDTTETTSHAYLHLYFIYLWFLSIIAYIVPLRARAILEKEREEKEKLHSNQSVNYSQGIRVDVFVHIGEFEIQKKN